MKEEEFVPLCPSPLEGTPQGIASNAGDLIGQRQHIQLVHQLQGQHSLILIRERKGYYINEKELLHQL